MLDRWAFGILLSRSFALPTSGNGPPPPEAALLPFCDFLNHSPAATNFVTWDSDNRQVVLSPDRNYEAGEQVMPLPQRIYYYIMYHLTVANSVTAHNSVC